MSSDRLTRALAEIQAVLEEQRHEREDAVRQVAELEVSLDAARSQASERERSLIEANSRLLSQVEELSTTVARMQAQVRGGQGSAASLPACLCTGSLRSHTHHPCTLCPPPPPPPLPPHLRLWTSPAAPTLLW